MITVQMRNIPDSGYFPTGTIRIFPIYVNMFFLLCLDIGYKTARYKYEG